MFCGKETSKLHLKKLIYKTPSTVNKSFLFDVSFISYIPGYLTHIKYPVKYHNDDTMNLNKHYETYVFVQWYYKSNIFLKCLPTTNAATSVHYMLE